MNFKIYVVPFLFCVVFSLESGASGTREMVKIPAGTFVMGDDDIDTTRRLAHPRHVVQLDSFYMDKYEVTQGEYKQLMGINPIATKENVEITERFEKGERLEGFYSLVGDNYPIHNVSWYDAARYCNARSKAEGLEPCYDEKTWECDFYKNGYRLPTEAEWEYACRADTINKLFFDNWDNRLDYVNFFPHLKEYYDVYYRNGCYDPEGVVWDKPFPSLLPVGSKKPNNWGLYDMLGNVSEWCNDWRSKTYYDQSLVRNPRGSENGELKVVRGGSYKGGIWDCARRGGFTPNNHVAGFRCVRNNPVEEGDINRISPALKKLLDDTSLEDMARLINELKRNLLVAKSPENPEAERWIATASARKWLDAISIITPYYHFKGKNVVMSSDEKEIIIKMQNELSQLLSDIYDKSNQKDQLLKLYNPLSAYF